MEISSTGRIATRDGWPAIPFYKNVLVGPMSPQSGKFKQFFSADPTDPPFDHRRWGGESSSILRPFENPVTGVKKLDGPAIYAGPLFLHFGHFVAESLHRIWPRIVYEELGKLPLAFHVFNRGGALPRFIIDALAFFGVKPEELIFIDQPLHFERLYFPIQGRLMAGQTIDRRYSQIFDKHIANVVSVGEQGLRLYFSRKYHRHTGSFYGEAYIETLLEKSGFQIIYPEKHHISDVVSLLRSAEIAVFAEGSAIHHLELCGSQVPRTFVIGRRPGTQSRFAKLLSSVASEWEIYENILEMIGPSTNTRHHSAILDFKGLYDRICIFSRVQLYPFDEWEYQKNLEIELKDIPTAPLDFTLNVKANAHNVQHASSKHKLKEKSTMDKVSRLEVVQACLNLFSNPRYLEIGVWKGKTFFPAKATTKVAVDPDFPFDTSVAEAKYNNTEYFNGTSDDYFGRLDPETRFDVIYLDGLHTCEQIVRDLINSISFIHEKSIIIIDDVRPTSYHSSLANRVHVNAVKAALGSEDRNWMGDVYKVVYFIETFLQQFDFRTTADNHGQTILWRAARSQVPSRSLEWIDRAPIESIFTEESAFRIQPLADIIRTIEGRK